MKFKTRHIEREYSLLKSKNKQLYDIINDIDDYSQKRFKKEAVLTCIKRDMQEQIKIYGYGKPSVHLYWRGVDLRNWIYTKEEIIELTNYINEKYEYDPERSGSYKVAINHDVGKGDHLHVQSHPNTIIRKRKNTKKEKQQKKENLLFQILRILKLIK